MDKVFSTYSNNKIFIYPSQNFIQQLLSDVRPLQSFSWFTEYSKRGGVIRLTDSL